MDPSTRHWLLFVARRALRDALAEGDGRAARIHVDLVDRPHDPGLLESRRLFVSWHHARALVGCMGSLEPRGALEDAVAHLSVQAGLHDPRLPPATVEQWGQLHCEISLLSDPRPLGARGLQAIAAAVAPGRDGVLLEVEGRQAFFLPQVWDNFSGRAAFLEALCRKAGATLSAAEADAQAAVFTAEVFTDAPRL